MELTRRDAVVALAAIGVGVGGGGVVLQSGYFDEDGVDGRGTPDSAPDPDVDPVGHSLALAEVLYPAKLNITDEFVETYVLARSQDDDTYRAEMLSGLETLDAAAHQQHGEGYPALTEAERNEILHGFGLEDAAPNPDPDGDLRGRIRYYLIDEFLYALYTSPTGGKLVGTENPVGHPGGLQSYQRGSPE